MVKKIHCVKLNKPGEPLAQPPIPGEMGKKIHEYISQEAWGLWLNHQTMLINEYRLSMIDPKARAFLLDEMKKFLFGPGSEKPPGYVVEEKA